ncbi:MAG: quinolinate synthase NadA [Fidelibacterota bacterium]|nr:MAG: quinolinate synthase NadA [Candidatus Neomarinimicrobiota bacterium]
MRVDDRLDLHERINELRARRGAVILAHNYQLGEVQDIADFVGDSLDLSRKAASTSAEVVVFCGVRFMAETAAILSPDKIVLLPALEANCPLADMADAERLGRMKAEHPGAKVVCYVNSSAEVKAESDICCTSANATDVIAQIEPDREIIFLPDQYLGDYVRRVTGRPMILWPGFCPTHMRILPEHIALKRKQYPDARVIVHPECRSEVALEADEVLSTGGMCRYARETDASTIIVGTEVGMIHRLQKGNPDKHFVPVTEQAICPNMKMITLEHVLWALEELEHRIEIPNEISSRAEAAVQRMIATG